MSRTRAGLWALAILGWTSLAHALGLGEVEVRSYLNQPLAAVIPLSSTVPGELDDLVVELASNEEFERAGIERSEFLSSLRFQVQGNSIKVTSKQIAREPFVSFLLDVRWGGGRLLREYTVLLDPPPMAASASQRPAVVAQPAPSQPSVVQAPAPERKPQAAATPAPSAPAPAADPAAEATPAPAGEPAAPTTPARASGERYGPVAPKETLWSIAYQLRPDPSLTMDQMQVAIFNANPHAFHEGKLTGLMKGVMLAVPGVDEIRAVDPTQAKAQVAAARAGRATAPAAAAPAPAPAAEPAPAPAAEPAPIPEASPAQAAPETASADTGPAEPTSSEAQPEASAPAETPAAAAEAPASEAPVTTPAPPPVAEAPVIEEPGFLEGLIEQAGGLTRNPLFLPAAAGIVVLLLLLVAGRWLRNRYAQWSYERALRKAPVAGAATAAATDEDATQVAEPPSMQEAFEQAAEEPVAPPSQTQAFAPPPMQQTMQQTMQQPAAETMQHTMQQTQVQEPALAQSGGKVDFDVTGNFASETVQINLDAGDPVSEAEFHRAYGLYDEAALLLKQALQKDPKRTDARVKLAEIYFEASKQKEFVEVARELKGQLPPDEWQKIALLGSQIAGDDDLFKGGDVGVGGAVDLSFDEPATVSAPAPAAPGPTGASAPAASDSLDFKLEDIQLPEAPAAAPGAAPAAPAGDALEFDLGSLSLETPAAPAAAAAAAPPAPAGGDELSLDLGDFDLKPEASPSATPAAPAASAGGEAVDLSLDMPLDEAQLGAGDEASTKLDLARAYIDMGDNDMAKSLLNEVAQQGNDQQKKEAQELLKRVPG